MLNDYLNGKKYSLSLKKKLEICLSDTDVLTFFHLCHKMKFFSGRQTDGGTKSK